MRFLANIQHAYKLSYATYHRTKAFSYAIDYPLQHRSYGSKSTSNSKFCKGKKSGKNLKRHVDRWKLGSTSRKKLKRSPSTLSPVALISDGDAYANVALIPINLFEENQNDLDAFRDALAVLALLKKNSSQVELFMESCNNLRRGSELERFRSERPYTTVGSEQDLEQLDKQIIAKRVKKDQPTLTIESKYFTEASKDGRVQRHSLPRDMIKDLKNVSVAGMQLNFEMNMTNIRDAILNPESQKEIEDKPISDVEDSTLALSTNIRMHPDNKKTIPLQLNALIHGTVNIDPTKFSKEKLGQLQISQFNEYVTAVAANLCSTALQKGFPMNVSRNMYKTDKFERSGEPYSELQANDAKSSKASQSEYKLVDGGESLDAQKGDKLTSAVDNSSAKSPLFGVESVDQREAEDAGPPLRGVIRDRNADAINKNVLASDAKVERTERTAQAKERRTRAADKSVEAGERNVESTELNKEERGRHIEATRRTLEAASSNAEAADRNTETTGRTLEAARGNDVEAAEGNIETTGRTLEAASSNAEAAEEILETTGKAIEPVNRDAKAEERVVVAANRSKEKRMETAERTEEADDTNAEMTESIVERSERKVQAADRRFEIAEEGDEPSKGAKEVIVEVAQENMEVTQEKAEAAERNVDKFATPKEDASRRRAKRRAEKEISAAKVNTVTARRRDAAGRKRDTIEIPLDAQERKGVEKWTANESRMSANGLKKRSDVTELEDATNKNLATTERNGNEADGAVEIKERTVNKSEKGLKKVSPIERKSDAFERRIHRFQRNVKALERRAFDKTAFKRNAVALEKNADALEKNADVLGKIVDALEIPQNNLLSSANDKTRPSSVQADMDKNEIARQIELSKGLDDDLELSKLDDESLDFSKKADEIFEAFKDARDVEELRNATARSLIDEAEFEDQMLVDVANQKMECDGYFPAEWKNEDEMKDLYTKYNKFKRDLDASDRSNAFKGLPSSYAIGLSSATAIPGKGDKGGNGNSAKKQDPHIICVRKGKKGCKSPGLAENAPYIAKKTLPSDTGSKRSSISLRLLECGLYQKALDEASSKKNATKVGKRASSSSSKSNKTKGSDSRSESKPNKKKGSECRSSPPCQNKSEKQKLPPDTKQPSKTGDKSKCKDPCKRSSSTSATVESKRSGSSSSKSKDPCKSSSSEKPQSGDACKRSSCAPKKSSSKNRSSSSKKSDLCKRSSSKEKSKSKDPCKMSSSSSSKKKSDPCKRSSSEKRSSSSKSKKSDPCKRSSSKSKDPCKKSSSSSLKKSDPCKKSSSKSKDPCKRSSSSGSKKSDPCKRSSSKEKSKSKDLCKGSSFSSSKKSDPCKRSSSKKRSSSPGSKKSDPCKRSSSKSKDPCKRSSSSTSKKADPCKRSSSKSKDPCKRSSSSSSKKADPCKRSSSKSKDPCKKSSSSSSKRADPCKRSSSKSKDPCKRSSSSSSKKADPCKRSSSRSKDPCKRSSSSSSKKSAKGGSSKSCSKKTDKSDTCPVCTPKRKYHSLVSLSNPFTKCVNDQIYEIIRSFSDNCPSKEGKTNYLPSDPHTNDLRKATCKQFSWRDDRKRRKRRKKKKNCYPDETIGMCPDTMCYRIYLQYEGNKRNKRCAKRNGSKRRKTGTKENKIGNEKAASTNKLKTECRGPLLKPVKCVNQQNRCYSSEGMENQEAVILSPFKICKRKAPIQPIKENDVGICIDCVALSDSDIHMFETGAKKYPDLTLGNEASGVVQEVGENVKNLKSGDHVAIECGVPCGRCSLCRTGRYNLCHQLTFRGCLKSYCTHPASFCHKISERVPLSYAAMVYQLSLGCNACVQGGIKPNSSVAIIGSCAMTLCTAMCAKAMGCSNVCVMCNTADTQDIVFENVTEKVECIDSQTKERGIYRLICDSLGKNPDVIINCLCSTRTMNATIMALKPGGTCVICGFLCECAAYNVMDALMKEIRIVPSFRSKNMFPLAIHLLEHKQIPIECLIADCMEWKSLEVGFEKALKEANCGPRKIIVQCHAGEK